MYEEKLLNGTATAATIREQLTEEVSQLKEQHQMTPGLAVILVGQDPASVVYVGMKKRTCEKIGLYSQSYELPDQTSESELCDLIQTINADPRIHGILVQHPLPKGLDEDKVFASISPQKDVDGISIHSMGALLIDRPTYVSCTAAGMVELLDRSGIEIKGKHAVVVGRSKIVGKPMAMLLLNRHATLTVCHTRTRDLAEHTRTADILVAAAGRPEMITGPMVKEGVVVLDAGYNRVEGVKGDVGDVQFASVAPKASAITPVPGGVGPMTIAMLMKNTVQAAKAARSL